MGGSVTVDLKHGRRWIKFNDSNRVSRRLSSVSRFNRYSHIFRASTSSTSVIHPSTSPGSTKFEKENATDRSARHH